MNLRYIRIVLALYVCFSNAATSESYEETLQLTPLPDGKVSARFEFKTFASADLEDDHGSDDRRT